MHKNSIFFLQIRASDHALEYPPCKIDTDANIDAVVARALNSEAISEAEAEAYKTKVLVALGCAYEQKGIVQQWHMNANRDNNKAMFFHLHLIFYLFLKLLHNKICVLYEKVR